MSATSPKTYVITGANRGLGLEIVSQLLSSNPEAKVVATARKPADASTLHELEKEHKARLQIIELDTASEQSIKAAAFTVDKLCPDGVDYLWNNAGRQEAVMRSIDIPGEEFLKVLNVNVVGTFLCLKHFRPLLAKKQTRIVINTTSIMGSISFIAKSNSHVNGHYAAYNSSKSAINMMTTVLAKDLASEGFTVIALHPGWVQTDMGNAGYDGGHEGWPKAPLVPKQSAAGQLKVVHGLTKADSGKYLSYDGNTLDY